MSSSSVSLQALPQELIMLIADQLTVKDLAHFRKTCSKIRQCTVFIFSKFVFIELKPRILQANGDCEWTKEVLEKLTPKPAFNHQQYLSVITSHLNRPSAPGEIPFNSVSPILLELAIKIDFEHKGPCVCQVE